LNKRRNSIYLLVYLRFIKTFLKKKIRENYNELFVSSKNHFLKYSRLSEKKNQRKIAVSIKHVHLNLNSLFNVLLFVFFFEKNHLNFN